MSFSLKLLGGIALADDGGPVGGPAVQRHRLALLALPGVPRPGAVSRDKLLAWLWPERETEPARRLLNQAVHALRQALGPEAILSTGDDLHLNRAVIACDVVAFEAALAGREPDRAVALYAGPFLDGFFLDDAPELDHWVERERDRLAGAYAKALEELAETAERAGDWGAVVERWKARAAHDRYDSRVALRLMEALEKSGNRAGALQHARQHRELLREELELEAPADIQAMVERLRREPAPGRPAAASPAAVIGALPESLPAAVTEPPPRSRRGVWYGAAAAIVAALGVGGAIRLAARSDEARPVATPAADEIARAVARELNRRERGDTAVMLPRHRTRSIPAYELYLRGDDPALVRTDSGARRGLEYFRRAVALDSGYAAAWVGVARLTYRASARTPESRARAKAEAEVAVRRALALDDSLADAHALLGVFRGKDRDWATAERHFRRAIDLDPGQRRAREWFVQFLLLNGRRAEALGEAERLLAIDPMAPTAVAELARALAANGQCEEALDRLKTIESLEPPLQRTAAIAASCYARLGRGSEAIALLQPRVGRDSTRLTLAMLGYLRARAGEREAARAIQAELLEQWRAKQLLGALLLVYVPAGLGDRDEAFAWLDRAVDDGSMAFSPGSWVDLADIPFHALTSDPRMDRFLERIGLQNR